MPPRPTSCGWSSNCGLISARTTPVGVSNSKAFGKIYRDAVKVAPDNQSSWTFDAISVLSAAINKAGTTDPAKVREAILAIKKFPGAEGEYNFDQNGDGLHGYNIVKNEKGSIVFDKHIEFND